MIESDQTLFSGVSHSRTADEVVQQIELLILDGVLRDGDRLPGERELSQSLEVSRPILRDALKELENRGLLISHHGGGTFVADIIGQVFSKPITDLISRHARATRDYLEYRRELEGLTAELAAQRATETDKALLSRIIEDMRHAHGTQEPEDELAADVEFHNAVGEAAHNIILLHTMRACYRLLSEGIFFNRKAVFSLPNARERLLDQHVAIHDAILAGDPEAAKAAAQAHIDFVMRAADESARAGEWGRVAKLRLIRRDGGRTGRTANLSKTETKA
ncbi:MAG: FadR family transcriptional regulator [Alphaproteobacteria bacterium]|jgi:GntR family transcriptional repressor for pyruvate dehydrogenase complex|uniref:FadR/GntR family transcriptional regulator n=1 Tax=Rhizobium/Agrobacterium group TaxID=227290 RepID=UPI0006B8A776|nr:MULTISPECIES: FadR/GntR family transcriptional regulator [Rhizobium/Agrobacterium group]MBU0740531.1 FadR family transcriptional regulator [Alphaproteobacteria bacterium]MBU0831337.1 FadR family transcriptional regulator [Alphaproteobacteria bacterium]MBU1765452.1 FadR family transcriptional regulator [Alphaproteobacteria bacterium]QGG89463.1 FCD domain-containing protein [Agrobacterium sp. MA01]